MQGRWWLAQGLRTGGDASWRMRGQRGAEMATTAAEHLESQSRPAPSHGGPAGVWRAPAPSPSRLPHVALRPLSGESLAGVQRCGPWAPAPGRRTGGWFLRAAVRPAVLQPQPCSRDGPWAAERELGGFAVHSGPGSLLAGAPQSRADPEAGPGSPSPPACLGPPATVKTSGDGSRVVNYCFVIQNATSETDRRSKS